MVNLGSVMASAIKGTYDVPPKGGIAQGWQNAAWGVYCPGIWYLREDVGVYRR